MTGDSRAGRKQMRSKLEASYRQVKLMPENVENTGFFPSAGVKVSELSKLNEPEPTFQRRTNTFPVLIHHRSGSEPGS